VYSELEKMWKEVVMAKFKVLSWHIPGGTEEIHKNLSQDSQCPSRNLNPVPPENKAGVLSTRPHCSVTRIIWNGIREAKHGNFRHKQILIGSCKPSRVRECADQHVCDWLCSATLNY
jgi:hypothetical protein